MSYYNRHRHRTLGDRVEDHFATIVGVGAFLLFGAIIVLMIWSTNAWVNTKHSYEDCLVTSKESITKDKDHQYRIYTENCGVFQVKDELWLSKFNSADTYNRIQQGKTYDFQTIGWRNGFFSTFENIVEVR